MKTRSVLECGSPLPLCIRDSPRHGQSENPNGIPSQSPGLRGTSYPGKGRFASQQPQRGCGILGLDHDRYTTPLALRSIIPSTQGSSFLATLGWTTQSLRDWRRTHAALVMLLVAMLLRWFARACVWVVALLTAVTLHAQLVADGATNTLGNVTNAFTGDVFVGTNGSFTLLVLSNNVLLTNTGNGLIGLNTTAKSNEVRLLSSTARWQMGGSLFVGSNGAFNRLVVSNGAFVENNNSFIGRSPGSSNNSVFVIGDGSLWSNRNDLTLGNAGAGNQLIVSGGGRLANRIGYMGRGAGSSNNFALVSGSGSVWSHQLEFFVGNNDRSNRLVIENGGLVNCGSGFVGNFASASNNEVLVTGAGSLWTNRDDLTIGFQAGANRLVVSNGAAVRNRSGGVGGSSAAGNHVVITGTGSVWSNRTFLFVGAGSAGNRADVNDGGWLACNDGYIGQSFSANSNTVVLKDGGSGWNNLGRFIVGDGGSGNVLIASNGATVLSSNAFIGASTSLGNNNSALLTGAGTVWSNRADFTVGNFSFGNRLEVSDGALMRMAGNITIGATSGARSNSVTLADAGSQLKTRYVFLGSNGPLNRLVISNAARLESTIGYIGDGEFQNGGASNEVVVTGPGSLWANEFFLYVGEKGDDNRLVIANGGQVRTSLAKIGDFYCSGNQALVTGAGSLWKIEDELQVGGNGPRSRLIVTNSGVVEVSNSVYVGYVSCCNSMVVEDAGILRVTNAAASGLLDIRRGTTVLNGGWIETDRLLLTNTQAALEGLFEFNGGTLITRSAVIDSTPFVVGKRGGAIWEVKSGNHVLGGRLIVGTNASFNGVFITDGATLNASEYTFLGFTGISNFNNQIVVSGPGSALSSPFGLIVDGSANRMRIDDGGKAFANVGASGTFIGLSTGTRSNAVIVADPDSSWSVNDALYVGGGGNANQLVVSNGAAVSSLMGYVGSSTAGSNNVATVTGTNSAWNNVSELFVGSSGSGNRLVVSEGGTAINSDAYVGFSSTSRSNSALVAGAGALWSNGANLHVGFDGRENQLIVNQGGTVASSSGFLGFSSLGTSNTAFITDPGSVWSNWTDLTVGNFGNDNTVVVSNRAMLVSSNCTIGSNSSATFNAIWVRGSGSCWSNANRLRVGQSGSANFLRIDEGGAMRSSDTSLGENASSTNNLVLILGTNSVWTNTGPLRIGADGKNNQLLIENGARLQSFVTYIGFGVSSSSNRAVVNGSSWNASANLNVGHSGTGNRFVVMNGGRMRNTSANIGANPSASNNLALVTGPGSSWTNLDELQVGVRGSGNQLIVSNAGLVFTEGVVVGSEATSTNNRSIVDGGTLLARDAGAGALDIRRGTHVLNAGLIDVDLLLLTNVGGFFEFNGGTLSAMNSRVSNGTLFRVGDGVSPATFNLAGNGLHEFNAILAATISSNATFTGNGTMGGAIPLQFLAGSRLAPGASVGKMVFSNSPALSGTAMMEISKNGTALTNDQIQVLAPLTYGGSLVVSNLGPTALAMGDRFPLFSAPSYTGAFSTVTLPPLPVGLDWTNKLSLDGSIEVIGSVQPGFAGISLAGTNVILFGTNGVPGANYAILTATNIALPLSNWLSIATNQFDAGGGFSFSNAIIPGEPQRYFELRIP